MSNSATLSVPKMHKTHLFGWVFVVLALAYSFLNNWHADDADATDDRRIFEFLSGERRVVSCERGPTFPI